MTSTDQDLKIGSIVYVPFWIVMECLDTTPPDPFIKCTIISFGQKSFQSPNGLVHELTCSLNLGKNCLNAYDIPICYILRKEELKEWTNKIINWFSEFTDRIVG